MSVINKRNAVVGWAAWKVVKQAAKRKAARSLPSTNGAGQGRKLVAAVPLALAAAGGAVVFWRRQHDKEPTAA
jgi:uncharacterized protein HemX